MTDFKPFKDYMIYVFDKFNKDYKLQSPFLDGGAGQGEFSLYLANNGFYGDAVDLSDEPLKIAKQVLKGKPVNIIKKDIIKLNKKYNSIFLFDIIEHIEDDFAFFKKVSSKLNKGGHIVITTPSNPKEWGWDDDSYGHIRRYTKQRISKLFEESDVVLLKIYDITFPFFWIMRKASVNLLKPNKKISSKLELTKDSSLNPFWKDFPFAKVINNFPLWIIAFMIQFRFRNSKIGQEFMIIGRKR